jgi:EAL and modified HD-GYP domain-containing signal transduction protein
MENTLSDEARRVQFATRQPILAADETVVGYKLLFRTDVVSHFSPHVEEGAARRTIDMSTLLGLDVLCDHRLAFIGCDRETLLEQGLAFLPADRVVAEIERGVEVDDEVIEACCELKNAGYRIALDGFTSGDPRQAIAHLADYLKVDMKNRAWEEIPELVGPDHWKHAVLVATDVESREDFDVARRNGFQLFQGFFFRKPESLRTRTAPTNRIIYLRLLQAVMQAELDWDRVEELIKSDPTLYYRLLRFLNSPLFGIRGEVRTVRQAFTLMGEDELRRWCRLAGMFEMAKGRPGELLLSALVRARFAESLGARIKHDGADLFLLGLLSMMDSILEIPMSAVIQGLPLDERARRLLLEHDGELAPVYRLVSAVEAGAWRLVVDCCGELGVPEDFAAGCYSEAMAWAQALAASV